jgi:hypothetical protein
MPAPARSITRCAGAGMPNAVASVGRPLANRPNIQEEFAMNRSITLSLTLAVALASQLALGGCTKKEDVTTAPTADTTASAPDTGASSAMSSASTPMDSISSASAVAGSGADAAASAASQ